MGQTVFTGTLATRATEEDTPVPVQDAVGTATEDNLASFDAAGQVKDSAKAASDVHTKLHGIDTAADHNGVAAATEDNVLSFDAVGLPKDSAKAASDIHTKQHGIDTAADHNGVSGATEDNILTFDANGLPQDGGMALAGLQAVDADLDVKVYSQDAEPTLATDGLACFWIDTDDTNRVWLVFRRGTGDQVKLELV